MTNTTVSLPGVSFGNALPLALIAGPCQMESRDHAFMMAGRLKEICQRLGLGLVYKSSFDKANRTSLKGKRGMGLEKSLAVFADIRKELGLPVLTDVHENAQCAEVASVVDVLQIPAFLCRQTDLLVAAAKTGRVVNVKKGQFLAPWDMKNVLEKIVSSGNLRHARPSHHGGNGCAGDLRCHPFGAAAGRPRIVLGWRPAHGAGPGARRRRGRCGGRLHRNP
jgi:2-dehydro-3-deoxyphosphooctonate aldolase (KDO 8-P synthase)